MKRLFLFYKVLSTKLPVASMKLFLHEDNLRDIQVHLTLFLAELSILKTHFFLVFLVNGTR